MSNKITFTILVVVFLCIAMAENLPQRLGNWVKGEKIYQNLVSKVSFPEYLSGPLRGPIGDQGYLTIAGVVDETNKQRLAINKIALTTNAHLNLAAQAKVDDMFKKQYFEHISPDGKHPADIIKATGYDYLVVGENLALGNFTNDKTLVEAWMNSPGHRANILDGKFEEIGVAVSKGMFEGHEVWLAVQEFGTPASSCPDPGVSAKTQIDQNRLTISAQQASLDALKRQIDADQYQTQAQRDQAVAMYNSQAAALNKFIDKTKSLVEEYNAGVNSFNNCLRSPS